MNKRKKIIFAIRSLLGLFLIYWAAQFIATIYTGLNRFKAEIISKNFKAPTIDHTYDHFFKKENLNSGLTYYIRWREPISTYLYNKNISVLILKLQGDYPKQINNVVNITKLPKELPANVHYNVTLRKKLFKIARISVLKMKPANLTLNLNCDSIRLQENTEKLLYYRLKLGNVSISYDNNDLINFFMEKKGVLSDQPEMELMLKKYQQNIYLILAIPDVKDVVIPKNLISSILKQREFPTLQQDNNSNSDCNSLVLNVASYGKITTRLKIK